MVLPLVAASFSIALGSSYSNAGGTDGLLSFVETEHELLTQAHRGPNERRMWDGVFEREPRAVARYADVLPLYRGPWGRAPDEAPRIGVPTARDRPPNSPLSEAIASDDHTRGRAPRKDPKLFRAANNPDLRWRDDNSELSEAIPSEAHEEAKKPRPPYPPGHITDAPAIEEDRLGMPPGIKSDYPEIRNPRPDEKDKRSKRGGKSKSPNIGYFRKSSMGELQKMARSVDFEGSDFPIYSPDGRP